MRAIARREAWGPGSLIRPRLRLAATRAGYRIGFSGFVRLGPVVKTILSFFLLASASCLFAQGDDTAVPPDLAAARAHYQDALANVRKQYLQELEKLKADAVVENNSELIAAVSKEIESLGGSDTSPASAGTDLDGTEQPTNESLTARLTNTTWAWDGDQTFTLLAGGNAKWSQANAPTMTWKVVGAAPPIITGISPNGDKYRMIVDADLLSGKLFQGTKPVRITARVSPK